MDRLSAAARGWHTIQLAVLGFIGICGVLRGGSTSTPRLVQVLAGVLAVAAVAVACAAIFTVGLVAYPLNIGTDNGPRPPDQVSRADRQLRVGIRLTVLALILIVIAALSGWWPNRDATTKATPTGTSSEAVCGQLVRGQDGTVTRASCP